MSISLLLMPLLAQAAGTIGSPYASSLPLEIIEKKNDEARKQAQERAYAGPAAPVSRKGCMDLVQSDPQGSANLAQEALYEAMGRERVRAGLCLGAALTVLERFDEAREAFVTARDAAEAEDHVSRARLGDMAANAELAQGNGAKALLLLGPALADAKASGDDRVLAEVQIDRARGLVAVDQAEQAADALAAARVADPENAQAWLLSATLARRQDQLIVASGQIETAAKLAPRDPAVGLEAGVIAMLSGDADAARRSWQSVLEVAPQSPEAQTAKTYLAQTAPDDGPERP
ncbi:MAG: hypothetical protein VYD90_20580 [Pseudomonadota bacterium]|nr:hypothetical protein [Pseudomonadota bacterium]